MGVSSSGSRGMPLGHGVYTPWSHSLVTPTSHTPGHTPHGHTPPGYKPLSQTHTPLDTYTFWDSHLLCESPPNSHPLPVHYGQQVAVRILLECFLVIESNHWWWGEGPECHISEIKFWNIQILSTRKWHTIFHFRTCYLSLKRNSSISRFIFMERICQKITCTI